MESASKADSYWLVVLILATVVFRLALFDPFSLHEDEALYAAYATHIARTGDIFLDNWPHFPHDKHPLFFWLLGGVVRVFGSTETSIRILGLAADIGSTALVYLIGLRLGGLLAAVIAGTLYATSLLAGLHGLSVFIDPLTITFGLAGILLATHGRYAFSGVLLGVSVSMKLLAGLYVPIVGLYALAVGGFWAAVRVGLGLGGVVAVLFGPAVYNSAFGEGSFLGRGMQNQKAGFNLAREWWLSKAEFFVNLFEWLFASWLIRALVYVGTLGGVLTLFSGPRSARWFVIGAALSALLYYAGLSVISSPVYDRYFLYVIPLFALVAGIGLSRIVALWPGERYHAALAPVFFIALVFFAAPAVREKARAGIPFSALSRSAVFGGYVPLCNWLADAADGRRVWNRSLSWHLSYCLQGRPVEAAWFADLSPVLADPRPALLALSAQDPQDIVDEIRRSGWSVELLRQFGGVAGDDLAVYAIAPPA